MIPSMLPPTTICQEPWRDPLSCLRQVRRSKQPTWQTEARRSLAQRVLLGSRVVLWPLHSVKSPDVTPSAHLFPKASDKYVKIDCPFKNTRAAGYWLTVIVPLYWPFAKSTESPIACAALGANPKNSPSELSAASPKLNWYPRVTLPLPDGLDCRAKMSSLLTPPTTWADSSPYKIDALKRKFRLPGDAANRERIGYRPQNPKHLVFR